MITINNFSVSGQIDAIIKERKGECLFSLDQMVAGKYDTSYLIYVSKSIAKDVADMLDTGMQVELLNTLVYYKERLHRCKVDSLEQIRIVPPDFGTNSFSLTGRLVSDVKTEGAGRLFTIEQNVAGHFPSKYEVFLPKAYAGQVEELNLQRDDEILVLNGLWYQKDSYYRLRAGNGIQKVAGAFDLGIEVADEVFA